MVRGWGSYFDASAGPAVFRSELSKQLSSAHHWSSVKDGETWQYRAKGYQGTELQKHQVPQVGGLQSPGSPGSSRTWDVGACPPSEEPQERKVSERWRLRQSRFATRCPPGRTCLLPPPGAITWSTFSRSSTSICPHHTNDLMEPLPRLLVKRLPHRAENSQGGEVM